ncbi:hypothetical protein TcCL_NonESM08733 [Trypanosoma cruzi]|nr:hypothetical protein TcCL_NonESM08733 [Trypanosoma cruzi]
MLVLLMVHCDHTLLPHHMSSCSVGTITRATASCHHNTRAVKHPIRTAQLRPAGAAGSKGQSRLFRPAVAMALGVAPARLGGRCTMRPHCNACRQNSRGPPPPQQRNVQPTTTPPHYRPFLFCFIHLVCRSVCPIANTENKCTPSQKGRNKEKRRHDPTVPPRANTLVHPPPLPRRIPQSHWRVNTTICTTPSCTERWAGRSHASPAPFSHYPSVACPHKVANRIRVHTNPINTLTR